MYISRAIQQGIQNYLKTNTAIYPESIGPHIEGLRVEPCRTEEFGELSTNAAMILAKPLGRSPHDISAEIMEFLSTYPGVESVSYTGGFINMRLKKEVWIQYLNQLFTCPMQTLLITPSRKKKINVEFVSVNPTGPLHAGHGRNAVLGDAIAALLQRTGHDVTREYYINDAGGQVDALARSVYLRYREICGHSISDTDFDADMYKGDYLIPLAQHIATEFGGHFLEKPKSSWGPYFKKTAVDWMMNDIKKTLDLLGVTMDVFTSERDILENSKDYIQGIVLKMTQTGDFYEGVLPPPKGQEDAAWESRVQTLFCSTRYGDDLDRAIQKLDGEWTYFFGDIIHHALKIKRGYNPLITVLGADHAGYVGRLNAAVTALDPSVTLLISLCQMVNFMDAGKPVRMSKRSGALITINDVIGRVGRDATRFMMVSRNSSTAINFDFAKVLEQTRDNPLFYIQYAHARICSVLRYGAELGIHPIWHDSYEFSDADYPIIRYLADWVRHIDMAAESLEPHRISQYLYNLASYFHNLWAQGKEMMHLKFIDPLNPQGSQARLCLLQSIQTIIQDGLKILGITPLTELR